MYRTDSIQIIQDDKYPHLVLAQCRHANEPCWTSPSAKPFLVQRWADQHTETHR